MADCRSFGANAGASATRRVYQKPAQPQARRSVDLDGKLVSVPPLITLTTDFGTADPYVAEMKGVLLGEGPADLRLVDLSHELPPFDVYAAALFLRAAVPRFPDGTIHLVVVDPGVGSERAPIVAKLGNQLLVGPDNRVFGYLFDGSEEVYVADPKELGARALSATFHGRDLFAPLAARLAHGAEPRELGVRAESYQHLVFPLVELSGDTLIGRVIHVDRFGNLITNITRSVLFGFLNARASAESSALTPPLAQTMQINLGEQKLRGLATHYAEAKAGELLALIGSNQLLEVAVREGNAALKLGAQVGKPIRVQRE
jgi:S-adenosyl-L-methionine hydrolase (adenosine-forming)